MDKGLFRKKSIDKVKSPESLNDYIRVSKPSIWIFLAAVVILLIGAVVWGILGRADTKISAVAVFNDGVAICDINSEDLVIEKGMIVEIGEKEGTVADVEYIRDGDKNNCKVTIDANIPNGRYEADIIVERIKPLSFVFN